MFFVGNCPPSPLQPISPPALLQPSDWSEIKQMCSERCHAALPFPTQPPPAPSDFHNAGQQTLELRTSPLDAGSCQESTGLHSALLGLQGQLIAAKNFLKSAPKLLE